MTDKELADRLAAIEKRLNGHDAIFAEVLPATKSLDSLKKLLGMPVRQHTPVRH